MEKPIAPDIQEVSSLSKLTENRRRFLQARLQRYFFGSGDVIIEQGRRGQFMGIVGHGLIDLESADGEIRTLLPGQIMGEEMMIEGAPSPYKAIARSDSAAIFRCSIARSYLESCIKTTPRLFCAEAESGLNFTAFSKAVPASLFLP